MPKAKKHSKENQVESARQTHFCSCCSRQIEKPCLPCTVIRHPVVSVDLNDELTEHLYSDINKENDGNMEQPALNTILALERQMRELQMNKVKSNVCSTSDLSPRSKAIVIPKISQKLNFPPDKPVFRNLIPLNVNDCNLLPRTKPSIRNKYIRSAVKAPTPELADFLDPLPPLEYEIPVPNIELTHVPPDDDDPFGQFLDFYREVNPRWSRSDFQL